MNSAQADCSGNPQLRTNKALTQNQDRLHIKMRALCDIYSKVRVWEWIDISGLKPGQLDAVQGVASRPPEERFATPSKRHFSIEERLRDSEILPDLIGASGLFPQQYNGKPGPSSSESTTSSSKIVTRTEATQVS